jgi:hypothetical protein
MSLNCDNLSISGILSRLLGNMPIEMSGENGLCSIREIVSD